MAENKNEADKKISQADLEKERRAQRMAAALRDNLRKRKTLQRAKMEEEKESEKNEDEVKE